MAYVPYKAENGIKTDPYHLITSLDGLKLHYFYISSPKSRTKLCSFSPLVMKIEAYLRLTSIPYTTEALTDLSSAPRGQLPYISVCGHSFGDSTLIIENVLKKHYPDPDAMLTPSQRAIGTLIQRTVENDLYWTSIFYEFSDPSGSEFYIREAYGGMNPFFEGLKKDYERRLWAVGATRYTTDELLDRAKQDLKALATVLEGRKWVLGTERATSYDAVMFGGLAPMFQMEEMHVELTAWLRSGEEVANLKEWVRKCFEEWFPELEIMF